MPFEFAFDYDVKDVTVAIRESLEYRFDVCGLLRAKFRAAENSLEVSTEAMIRFIRPESRNIGSVFKTRRPFAKQFLTRRWIILAVVTAFGICLGWRGAVAQTAKNQAGENAKSTKQANMIPVGTFALDTLEQGQPKGWKQSTWGGRPIFEVDRTAGHQNNGCVKISSANGANASWSYRVKVRPNTNYRLSAWIKTEKLDSGSGFGAVANLHELQFDGKSKGLDGDHDWTHVSVEANSRNHTSLLVNLTFGGWGNATGTAWFDDVVLHEIPSPDSLGPFTEAEAIAFYKNKVKPILVENCHECHGSDPDDLGGALALTSRASILRGGDSGPAVDSNSLDESLLLKVINYDIYEMPPSGKMPSDKIKVLRQWVKLGMPFDPADEKDVIAESHSTVPTVNEETKKWWSFQPVSRPEPPAVNDQQWPINSIDQFVLGRLESNSLQPATQATRGVLIRRVYYDLLGLPPSPEEVEAFVADPDPNAYEKLVDRLLESPHYGEKWGRHWLDLVRYAESNSFERDGTKPFVWRYRDYVIRSFNEDKPYDQFLMEQLAGDEISNPTRDTLIATGYYRLGQWDDEPVDALKAKYDELDDIVKTTSQTMLGLTVDCARCHDHKIDPIPQSDYYAMVSFFENIRHYGVRSNESVHAASVKTVLGQSDPASQKSHQKRLDAIEEQIEKIVALARPDFQGVEREDFQYEMNQLAIMKKRIGNQISQKQFDKFRQLLNRKRKAIENPPGSIKVLCVKENGAKPIESFVRVRGNPHVTGPKVEPSFISVLDDPNPSVELPPHGESTGRRLAFAKWLVDPENPLTARVMVNRLWQYHFGRGLVRTTSDFGFQGTKPTHPELLDWLASEFVARKWSLKQMHRLMMNSRAYQMSSQFSPEGYEKDPANDLFWRFDLRRLTAEEIRDSILAVNGQLKLDKMYGPSIFPIMPKEVLAGQSRPGQNWGNSSEEDRRRRSIYIHIKRSLGLPILTTNDSADTDNPCPVRFITTQPTQSLGMLNSEFTNLQAKKFAKMIRMKYGDDPREQVSRVLERVTQRPATETEIERGIKLMASWIDEENATPQQALEYFCLMAINLNEFVYVD